jgi:ABC-2 type transport system permease protein
MRLYLEVARKSFRRQMSYRTANLAGIAVNFFFTCLRVFIFTSVLAYRSQVAGYNLSQIITYMCLTEALMMTTGAIGNSELMDSVTTGRVAMDLVRPWDFFLYWLSRNLGRAVYFALYRALPLFILSWIVFGIQLPANWATTGLFLISVCLAALVSSVLGFLVNFAAMWTTDARGVAGIAGTLMWFFSGMLLPPEFLPRWLRTMVWWLPFQAQLYSPAMVYLGQVGPLARWQLMLLQALWSLLLIGLAKTMIGAGRRKLTVQGG